MSSFSSRVKDELSEVEILTPCCQNARLYGMLLFGRAFSQSSISVSTEHSAVVSTVSGDINTVFGFEPFVSGAEGRKNVVSVASPAQRGEILDYFGHSGRQLALRLNRANIANECCFSAFVRGAFLSCGTVTDPEKNYHLEFVVPYLKLSNDLMTLLTEVHFSPKLALRNGTYIIYFKESESIEDILTYMGATNSTLELMSVKMTKDVRNNINRKVNFETANITRAANAGVTQLDAVRLIERHAGLSELPPQLREAAVLRRDNPDATLRELCEMISEPISRSGMNHRLNRLVEIASEYTKNK